LGAYVGEVIRRHYGGEWQGDDADPAAEINVAVRLNSGTIFWPMQRVMKRFKNGPEDGIYVYGRFMEHREFWITADLSALNPSATSRARTSACEPINVSRAVRSAALGCLEKLV
jgi:hypothetical protein